MTINSSHDDIESYNNTSNRVSFDKEGGADQIKKVYEEEAEKKKKNLNQNIQKEEKYPEYVSLNFIARGENFYSKGTDSLAFKDSKSSINNIQEDSKAIEAVLQIAKQRGWDPLSINGSPNFISSVEEMAKKHEITVTYSGKLPDEEIVPIKKEDKKTAEKKFSQEKSKETRKLRLR